MGRRWVSTTRVMVERFIQEYFPTTYTPPPGADPAAQPTGEQQLRHAAASASKQRLLDKLARLELPANFLDEVGPAAGY